MILPLSLWFGGLLEEWAYFTHEFFLFAGAFAFAVGDSLEQFESGGFFLVVKFGEAGFQKAFQVLEDCIFVLQQETGGGQQFYGLAFAEAKLGFEYFDNTFFLLAGDLAGAFSHHVQESRHRFHRAVQGKGGVGMIQLLPFVSTMPGERIQLAYINPEAR